MPIRRSSAAEIQSLVKALTSANEVTRESAIARLTVIGGRAVDRLVAAYPQASREMRIAILRALEGIGDPRGASTATEALRDDGDVAIAAAATLKPLLQSPDTRIATDALDALVATALNGSAERRVRLAALEALADMPEAVRAPLIATLRKDVRLDGLTHGASVTEATWRDAIEGHLPEDPGALRAAAREHADAAPLGALQKLVDAVRDRELEAPAGAQREGWRQARGAIHQVLALRGSRVAVYDLRETFGAAREPLPATFLAAAQVVGDESCLEPIAGAWTAASGGEAEAWRYQLHSTFTAIVKREKISKRSAVLKRIAARWPAFKLP